MKVLRLVVRLAMILVAFAAGATLIARLHDGPLGPLPGGALASGVVVAEPVADWSFAATIPEIEMQLDSQAVSRTVWIIAHDGKAYVPAAVSYPPGKTWHEVALKDGRGVLRIDGKRYPVTLRKVEDPAVIEAVRETAFRKYPARPSGEVWLFEVTSRAPAA